MLDPRHHSQLLCQLGRESLSHPLTPKLLVCRLHGQGHELLRALARAGVGWLGFEVVSPGELAARLVAPALAAEGSSPVDEFDQRACVDEALDAVVEAGASRRLRELAETGGFRDAVWDSIQALRLAGVTADHVRKALAPSRTGKRDFLAAVLDGYVQRLADARQVDTAAVLDRATRWLQRSDDALRDTKVYLLPGLTLRGRTGILVRVLLERGARILPGDPVVGFEPPVGVLWSEGPPVSALSYLHTSDTSQVPSELAAPDIVLFAAATPTDELREVLRRLLDACIPWDEVELVTTDPARYGAALHALGARLDVPATFAAGLPVERSRYGKAITEYFRWLREDFPAAVLWRLLETGVIVPPGQRTRGPALARRLRRLRIGWGRTRYREALETRIAELELPPSPEDDRSAEEIEEARRDERAELEELKRLIIPLVECAPDAPDHAGTRSVRISPAAAARGLLRFLDLVAAQGEAEGAIKQQLTARLYRAAATLVRECSFAHALSVLSRHLEVRIEAPHSDENRGGRLSAGGCLHLTDIAHGGYTGRRHTFVLGLDAHQFPGAGAQDALLVDRDRAALNQALADPATDGSPHPLSVTADILAERRHRLAALLARLRGRVTLSYCSWESAEGRTLPPSPLLLDVLRLQRGDSALKYTELHEAVGEAACTVPRAGSILDAADVWLQTMHSPTGTFLSGIAVVSEAFPSLARGALGLERWSSPHFGAQQGRIEALPHLLDPRQHERPVSARALEELGRCPLAYLYGRVLRVKPPDDPEPELGAWLDPLTKGTILHAVFEEALRESRARGIDHHDEAFPEIALRILEEKVEQILELRPVPTPAVLKRERERLREDVQGFVSMVRRFGAHWLALEMRFGRWRAGEPPIDLALPTGPLHVAGRIDRVDELPNGHLRVVDYKTGSSWRFRSAPDVLDGGRRLQHVIYARAAEVLLDRPVEAVEYHFPTRRGEFDRFRFSRPKLERGSVVIATLLDLVAAGCFLPTNDAEDCKFCDFRRACRVTTTAWGDEDSPPATWGNLHSADLPEYAPLKAARQADD